MAGSYATYANVKRRLGVSDDVDETFLTTLCVEANEAVEYWAQRDFTPVSGGTATFDASEDVFDGELWVRQGVRSITSLTVAPSTGETGISATLGDIIILPRPQNRRPGWPGFWLRWKDVVSGSVGDFGRGQGNIVLIGDFGWTAIPTMIVNIAEIMVVRAWHGRQSGQTDIIGSDETGAPIISRYLAAEDKRKLRAHRPLVVAGR